MSFDLLIRNGIILTMEPQCQPFVGGIGVKDGMIEAVWQGAGGREDARQQLDAQGMIVMPGLVNGHIHGDMTLARGLLEELTLLEQNEKVAPYNFLLDYLSDQDRQVSRRLTYAEALKGGTTFLCENMYWGLGDASIAVMRETGIHGALVEDARPDFTRPDRMVAASELEPYFGRVRSAGLLPVIGGISEEDFTPERLAQLAALRQETGAHLTLHLAETLWRMDLVRQRFGTSSIRYLEGQGFLSPQVIGSHVVWADDGEIDLLAARGVKVVNTPVCEMKIADGVAPIPKFLQRGVVVGLGTDGALWNNSCDLFVEMKTMALLHKVTRGVRAITARQVLEMATLRGAEVFGLEQQSGSLKAGKRADITLVNTARAHMLPLRLGRFENVLTALVFCATARDVEHVFVRGQHVVAHGVLTTLDEAQLYLEAQAIGDRLAAQLPHSF